MGLSSRLGANRLVVALSMARLGDAVGNSILFVVIPLYVAKLAAPAFPIPESVRVGILISLYGFVNSFLQPIAGAVSDRVNRRKIFIQIGLAIMAVSTVAFVFVTRFTELFILRAIQGIGVAFTVSASVGLLAIGTSNESRGGSMGIFTTLRMAGFGVGPLLGGFLYDQVGFNAAFVAGAAFLALGFVLVQAWVRDRPAAHSGPPRPFRIIDRELLHAGILGVSLATFIMATDFSMLATLETQFNTLLSESAFVFSVAFSALMLSRLVFQMPISYASDRLGRKVFILAGLLLMVPATALTGLVTSPVQLIGLRIVQGLASAGIAAPAFAVAGDLARTGGESRQMSLVTMGFGLGIATGPLIAGVLAVQSIELPFLVGGLLCIPVAWVVARYVPETLHLRRGSEGNGEGPGTDA